MRKYYFTFDHIHQIVKKSANEIRRSSFEPDYILAIAAGGFIPARILRTFIEKPIISVTVSSYNDTLEASSGQLKTIQWLEGVDIKNKKILLVDDIDDTRTTLQYCIDKLLEQQPAEIALFVLHNKIKQKTGVISEKVKHIFVGETLNDVWINYPWETTDIDEYNKCLTYEA